MKKFEMMLGGRPLSIETGRMAKQADGAVVVRQGDTMVLVTACCSRKPKENQDFFPLTVEYQERSYAGGKIPGGYFRREGKATEKETLTSRLIDRPIRPLFPEGFLNEVQVVATVLSADKENNPDILGIIGASCAILISGAPFLGPIAAARIGEIDGTFVINPGLEELKRSSLEIVIAVTERGIIMIEAGVNGVPEERIVQALEYATQALKPLLKLQKDLAGACGKPAIEHELNALPETLVKTVREHAQKELDRINRQEKTKESRDEAISALAEKLVIELAKEEDTIFTEDKIDQALHKVEYESVRKFILQEKVRTDGRKYDEIRPIACEIGVLPRTHGSALFTRGQTQSLGVVTLGTSRDEQRIDALEGDTYKNFMLHYNFPPFSVGEIKMMRGPGRREIGHGALAERGLRAVMPSKEEFPYTVRVVSDILESNGSSSMASVCSGSLALMDAGVPIKSTVSGIAMGLVKEGAQFAVLSDIAGVEDHLGDMDFKVTGTDVGVTALQLDVKLKESIEIPILRKALEQARQGRLFILEKMLQTMRAPKEEISPFAPRITTIKIDPEKIREIIGPGGKMIRKIQADSGASIEVADDGTVSIASADMGATQKAVDMISGIAADAEVGRVYKATVKRLMNFGAFCEFLPGKEGLVHVSEIASDYVQNVEDAVKVGDEVMVKLIEVDSQGRCNLSIKQSTNPDPPVVNKRERGEKSKSSYQKRPRS